MKTPTVSLLCSGLAALIALSIPLVGQNEQTAPAIPVEQSPGSPPGNALEPAEPAKTAEISPSDSSGSSVTDYADKISTGIKERERRLTLLNEAMMKLREAGEIEDASRVEDRIRALLEMPAPVQTSAHLHEEIEKLKTRNDELVIQMMAMEEELKKYRGPSKSSSRRASLSGTAAPSVAHIDIKE